MPHEFLDHTGRDSGTDSADPKRIRDVEASKLPEVRDAVDLMALASKAADLFVAQTGAEQQKLLRLVLDQASWKAGELRLSFREPFEQLRLSNSASNSNESHFGGGGSNSGIWR
jgi:hypothetical protein